MTYIIFAFNEDDSVETRNAGRAREVLAENGFDSLQHDDPLVLLAQVGFEVVDAESEETALMQEMEDIILDSVRKKGHYEASPNSALQQEQIRTKALMDIAESLKILAAPLTAKL